MHQASVLWTRVSIHGAWRQRLMLKYWSVLVWVSIRLLKYRYPHWNGSIFVFQKHSGWGSIDTLNVRIDIFHHYIRVGIGTLRRVSILACWMYRYLISQKIGYRYIKQNDVNVEIDVTYRYVGGTDRYFSIYNGSEYRHLGSIDTYILSEAYIDTLEKQIGTCWLRMGTDRYFKWKYRYLWPQGSIGSIPHSKSYCF